MKSSQKNVIANNLCTAKVSYQCMQAPLRYHSSVLPGLSAAGPRLGCVTNALQNTVYAIYSGTLL